MGAMTATVMIGQQLAGKAARDSLFLSSFNANQLPLAMFLGAGLALIGVAIMSRALGKFGPGRLVPGLFVANAGLFGTESLLIGDFAHPVAFLLYLHLALLGTAVVSGFWSVINERLTPRGARRRIAKITAGATLGGALGSLLAERASTLAGSAALLGLLGLANLICALGVARLAAGQRRVAAATEHGTQVLSRTPFLRRVAMLVVVIAIVGALLDFALKAQADLMFDDEHELRSFFSFYYAAVGVATFVLQALISQGSLESWFARLVPQYRAKGLFAFPLTASLGAIFAALVAQAWSVVFVRAATSVVEHSVFRSGYELLFTAVAPKQKRPTKLIIDVAGTRLGDVLGSAFIMALLLVLSTAESIPVCLLAAALLSAGAMVLTVRLRRGFSAQRANGLRRVDELLSSLKSLGGQNQSTALTAITSLEPYQSGPPQSHP